MKKIYFLIFTICVLVVNSINAQKQWCYVDYKLDTISYSPVQAYNLGTQMPVYHINQPTHTQFSYPDSCSAVIPIGFNFNFYGIDYNKLVISTAGFITFDTTYALKQVTTMGYVLPDYSDPRNAVLLWESTKSAEMFGSINYSTIGTAPNRKFVVSYDSVAALGVLYGIDTSNVYYFTGQIVLYESSSTIEMYILHSPDSVASILRGVQGVQNFNSQRGVEMSRSTNFQNYGRRLTPFNIAAPAATPICMVTVDSASGKNEVVWNQPSPGLLMDSIIIYRETNVANVYAPIGSQPVGAFSSFIDTASVPEQQANRYKLGFRDSCGVLSVLGGSHKTVHLTISQGIGNKWNLNWDAYEGFGFGSYNLYRGTTPSNMTLLTTIASNLYSYTDLNPPVGSIYYVIEVINANACNPGTRSVSSSFSNIVSNNVAGLASIGNGASIAISPNPATNQLTITSSFHEAISLSILNMLGQVLQSAIHNPQSTISLDVSKLSPGIYFLQLKGESGSVVKRFVKE